MYCQHCGAQLPDNAKFCTECGASTQPRTTESSPQNGELRVSRQSAIMASAIKTKVYVDGDLKCTLGNGQSLSFLLPVGAHRLEIKTPGNGGTDRQITVSPGVEKNITFRLNMLADGMHEVLGTQEQELRDTTRQSPVNAQPYVQPQQSGGRVCPKCGGTMAIQTISESRKAGCFTIILYILLAISILGLFILIPLMLRRKTETVTYAVCQKCGYKKVLSRSK